MDERRVDAGVIERCRQGDRGAFRLLFDAHKDRVYSTALRYLGGDAAAARDITQEVFLDLFHRISAFRGEADLSTWLHRIVANACLDERRRRRRLVPLTEAPEAGTGEQPGSPEGQIAKKELADEVERAVARLRPKIRIAILLKYFHDLSYEEMSKAMGCSIGTVASRLNTGHRILARRLAAMRGAAPPGASR